MNSVGDGIHCSPDGTCAIYLFCGHLKHPESLHEFVVRVYLSTVVSALYHEPLATVHCTFM